MLCELLQELERARRHAHLREHVPPGFAALCLGHEVPVRDGGHGAVRFGDVVCEKESSHVDDLSGNLDENGLAVHGHAVEPLQIVGIGYEEAPAVAPAGDGEPLRSRLALVGFGCFVVIGTEPQALAVHVGQVQRVVGEQVASARGLTFPGTRGCPQQCSPSSA